MVSHFIKWSVCGKAKKRNRDGYQETGAMTSLGNVWEQGMVMERTNWGRNQENICEGVCLCVCDGNPFPFTKTVF